MAMRCLDDERGKFDWKFSKEDFKNLTADESHWINDELREHQSLHRSAHDDREQKAKDQASQ
jgi:hypothetical protein